MRVCAIVRVAIHDDNEHDDAVRLLLYERVCVCLHVCAWGEVCVCVDARVAIHDVFVATK